jgi:hypothetical protein
VRDPDRYNPVVHPDAEPLAADTPMGVEQVLVEGLRGRSAGQKAGMVSAMSRAAQTMSLAGLRRRYPAAAPDELRLRLAALRLPRETMVRAFGWDPAVRGY